MTQSRWPLLAQLEEYADLKNLPAQNLAALAAECRDYIIHLAQQKQIHFSSNLGVIELSIALCRAFDLDNDIVFYDTGHQAYIHKMLTGRFAQMHTVRDTNGIAGLQAPDESKYDFYGGGHAGNALSVAAGYLVQSNVRHAQIIAQWRAAIAAAARVETSRRKRHKLLTRRQAQFAHNVVVAVIGDAALATGLTFEALNDLSFRDEHPIIVINDNGMSISPSVGALSKLISQTKIPRAFNCLERFLFWLLSRTKTGIRFCIKALRRLRMLRLRKDANKLFSSLGYLYLGPFDGHDIPQMIKVFSRAKKYAQSHPVIIHVRTKKGYGLNNTHDTSGVHHASGDLVPTVGTHIAEHLLAAAQGDQTIKVVNAAMTLNTGFSNFAKTLPNAYYDVGIAEEHAVAFAAAMSIKHLKPYVVLYSTFLQRAYDQLIHDVARLRAPVNLLIDRAEISGGDGNSHHGIFDVGFLKTFPHAIVFAPASIQIAKLMVDCTYLNKHNLMAIRYPKDLVDGALTTAELTVLREQLNKRQWRTIKNAAAVRPIPFAIVTYGSWVQVFVDLIKSRNLLVDVIDAMVVVGYAPQNINDTLVRYEKILIFEEIYGDLGLAGDFLKMQPLPNQLLFRNIKDFPGRGDTADVRRNAGLNPVAALNELLGIKLS